MTRRAQSVLCLAGAAVFCGCGSGAVDAVGLVSGGLVEGLIAHWTFDEGAGSAVRDSSTRHLDGIINGSTWSWISQGRFGGALHFESGDYVTVDNFPPATSGWTVSAWVQIASKDIGAAQGTIVSTEDLFKGGWEMSVIPKDDQSHFGFWQGPTPYEYAAYYCDKCIQPDRWRQITGVVDGSTKTLAFYLDGVLQGRVSVLQAISPGVSTLTMGSWASPDKDARFLVGSLDDIAIWSRPLVEAEVATLAQAPAPTQ